MIKLVFKVLLIGVVVALAHPLAHNFPGGSVGYAHPDLRRRGDEGRSTASTLRYVSNSHFRVVHSQSLDSEQAEHVLNILESGRRELLHRVASCLGAGIQTRFPNLEIVINETTGDFAGRTHMPPWAAAATKGIPSSYSHSDCSNSEEFWKQPCAMNSYMYSLIQSVAANRPVGLLKAWHSTSPAKDGCSRNK